MFKRNSKGPRQAGFTMIEMVIALVILFIAILGVFAAITYATKFNRGNSQRSQALAVMQREIELLRSAKFTPAIVSDGTGMTHQHTAPVCPNLAAVPTATPLPDSGIRDLTGGDKEAEFRCGIDGTLYQVNVRVDDDPYTDGQQDYPWPQPSPSPIALSKQIDIEVIPQGADGAWVTANAIRMTFRRVRGN